jgi:hypothetical protein
VSQTLERSVRLVFGGCMEDFMLQSKAIVSKLNDNKTNDASKILAVSPTDWSQGSPGKVSRSTGR